jgi:hypothetical protein
MVELKHIGLLCDIFKAYATEYCQNRLAVKTVKLFSGTDVVNVALVDLAIEIFP